MHWGTNEWRLLFEIIYGAAMALGTIAGWVYAWRESRRKAAKDELDKLTEELGMKAPQAQVNKLDQALDNHAVRLTAVEHGLAAVPSHRDLGAVYNRLNTIHGDLQKLTGTVEGQTDTLQTISEFLIQQGGNRQ